MMSPPKASARIITRAYRERPISKRQPNAGASSLPVKKLRVRVHAATSGAREARRAQVAPRYAAPHRAGQRVRGHLAACVYSQERRRHRRRRREMKRNELARACAGDLNGDDDNNNNNNSGVI